MLRATGRFADALARGALSRRFSAPSHHRPGGGYRNPPEWLSSRIIGPIDFITKALPHWDRSTRFLPQRVVQPDLAALERSLAEAAPRVEATLLGHCTFIIQSNGYRVLCDPFFSERASPLSFAGPKRFTPAPCRVSDLAGAPFDAVVLSHSHYDHLDEGSVRELLALPAPPRSWIVPIGLGQYLRAWGVAADLIVELDWWEAARPSPHLCITATPAQHGSARTAFDKDETLWCGFHIDFGEKERRRTVYFTGDTGYRTVEQGTAAGSAAEREAPVCPAFREIRERLGAPDLALLPIGAYSPRGFMSSVHASPEDAVRMFEDLGAKRAIAMHWGALPLTDEPVDAPPARLVAELKRSGHAAHLFVAISAGETWREP
jgi:N-acyl-phosphatidylethanolamine-hydrolysing phospholipase D